MTGWLRWMRTCFEEGKITEYWKSDLELEKWFDLRSRNLSIRN